MKLSSYFVSVVFLLGSCSSSVNSDQKESEPKDEKRAEWEKILEQTPSAHLPLRLHTHLGIPTVGLTQVNERQAELFFEGEKNYFLYGKLDFPSKIKAIIVLYPADVTVPRIYTFSKEGDFISKQDLFLNGNSMDCGFRYFSSNCFIDENRIITVIDTNSYLDCNDEGEEISKTMKHTITEKLIEMDMQGNLIQKKIIKTDLTEK